MVANVPGAQAAEERPLADLVADWSIALKAVDQAQAEEKTIRASAASVMEAIAKAKARHDKAATELKEAATELEDANTGAGRVSTELEEAMSRLAAARRAVKRARRAVKRADGDLSHNAECQT